MKYHGSGLILPGYSPLRFGHVKKVSGVAPTLSAQDATFLLDTTARGRVTTNQANGTLYWVATTSATAPSAAQVKAGQDNGGSAATFAGSVAVSSTGQKLVHATGLTANTAYTIHFMHENAGAQQSSVVSSGAFTTLKSNISTNPLAMDNANWAKTGVTITANQTAGPDGQVTADLMVETAASTTRTLIAAGTTLNNGTTYEGIVYFKKGPGSTAPDIVQMSFSGAPFLTAYYANFNINTGVVGTKHASVTSSITDLGGGWFRCRAVATANAGAANAYAGYPALTNNNDGLGKIPSYTGATTSDVYIGGAMMMVP